MKALPMATRTLGRLLRWSVIRREGVPVMRKTERDLALAAHIIARAQEAARPTQASQRRSSIVPNARKVPKFPSNGCNSLILVAVQQLV